MQTSDISRAEPMKYEATIIRIPPTIAATAKGIPIKGTKPIRL
jgi:hypothetical protein